jgi:hypothetical protein
MAAYTSLFDQIYSDPTFEKQVVIACLTAADTVIHEDPATANHDNRMIWARAVLVNPTQAARKMMPVMLVNPTVQSGSYTDTLWLVQSNIEAYSLIM